MKKIEIFKSFVKRLDSSKINYLLESSSNKKITIKNNYGSYLSLILFKEFINNNNSIIRIFPDKEEALYALNEAEEIFGKEFVLYFPDYYENNYGNEEINNFTVLLRFEVLYKLFENSKKYFIISYASALSYKVVPSQVLREQTYLIFVGQKIDLDFLNEVLFSLKFYRVDYVVSPGEFAVRGEVVDIFSFSHEKPFRVVIFINQIKEIKKFDIDTQLSVESVQFFTILSNLEFKKIELNKQSFFTYLSNNFLVVFSEFDKIIEKIDKQFNEADFKSKDLNTIIKQKTLYHLFLSKDEFLNEIQQFKILDDSKSNEIFFNNLVNLPIKPQPILNKNFQLLIENLKNNLSNGFENFISFQSEKQKQQLFRVLHNLVENVEELFNPILINIQEGFVDEKNKIVLYTDYQIFEQYVKYNDRSLLIQPKKNIINELNSLKIGDFVTHLDYGIGKFLGLKKIEVNKKMQESIKISFLNEDILYVSVHSLHKIARFSSKFETKKVPQLSKLGSSKWKNLKNNTKRKIKEVAFDLINLYAQRKIVKGFAFSKDNYLQKELETSFEYEDTEDQIRAIEDIKKDMESQTPMDRLVCGDVGFGKTEIAIRAAFKAVSDSKQVVVLVPTTILAFQHYQSFLKRLKDFPVTIDYLNRFRTFKEKKKIINDLKNHKIDILIGTHQVISSSIKYKDLGLLIVDEEHKLGVSIKDKLKILKSNLDTLTLSATPIPRTLQFSLMLSRDLSLINTPPPNRKSIKTILEKFNKNLLYNAINYELNRGGQVLFINNRIENIIEIKKMIQFLFPEANIKIGHGKMEGKQLEKNFIDFIKGKINVFVCTTILESGLDVSNANTILINDAQNFGMADLHQLRGRVGRSNRQAFCYFLIPSINLITQDAEKRLQAMELFSYLGSGFQIAMKDLEIRGAGDLLGAEQSGFISDIGFETYQKILCEAIEELKINKFSNFFLNEIKKRNFINEIQIESDFEFSIPDNYINKVEERFSFYKRLAEIENEDQLQNIEKEFIDRFGFLPQSVINLLKTISIKLICKKIGFEKLIIKQKILLAYFPESNSKYFQSKIFIKILNFINTFPTDLILKEKITKNRKFLFLRKEKVYTLGEVYCFLNKIFMICNNDV